jgi:hypothetical protein
MNWLGIRIAVRTHRLQGDECLRVRIFFNPLLELTDDAFTDAGACPRLSPGMALTPPRHEGPHYFPSLVLAPCKCQADWAGVGEHT